LNQIFKAIRVTLVLWLLTAVIYPLFMLACGQTFFAFQANGSLLKNARGEIIGSTLIGQPFSSEKYFWSRPSTVNYSTANSNEDRTGILKTGVSGASNLAPSNPVLLERIQGEIPRLQQAKIQPTADLIYTSGSGLDPHISIESARAQIARISQVRAIDTNQLEILISQNTDNRFLGIFGEPGVNVLKLNLALDAVNPNN
jgi:K+-transporting ATPase ATPase C chain